MRWVLKLVVIVGLLGVWLSSARAQTEPPTQALDLGGLSVVVPQGGDRPYRLGQPLRLLATGAVGVAVLAEWNQPLATRNLKLYLDGVEMKGLDMAPLIRDKSVELTFQLTRDPNNDDNRAAWNALLTREAGYVMSFPVSLAVGRQPPIGAKGPDAIHFEVADPRLITGVRLGAIALFCAVFLLLILCKPLSKILRDADTSYFSLGKAQMAFWGLLVFLAVVAIYVITGSLERIPTQTITLLGISGATGLSAALIGKSKRATATSKLEKLRLELEPLAQAKGTGTLGAAEQSRLAALESEQKGLEASLAAGTSGGFLRDICDDGNGPSFHRVQVLLWTVLLGAVFVQCVGTSVSMPEFPESLLLLMGISNGTYLGLKVPE